MKIEYTGRHIEITDAIRSHVESHFERIGHLFGKVDNHAHVIVEPEHGKFRAELVVKWRNQVLAANATLGDVYLSLSHAIDKIEKQALKTKDKVITKSHTAKKPGEIASDSNLEEAS